MLMKIKRFLNKFGFDIKRYHPLYETTLKPLEIRTIIDIGANTGMFSREMRNKFPDAQIYAFEPLPDCYEALISKMKSDKKFKSWNVALGDANDQAKIEKSSFHPSSSLLKMTELHKRLYPKSKDSRIETIEVKRLDDIRDLRLEKNILIKMDVQGFEDKVIAGGKKTIKEAAAIIIETSFVTLYENQPLFNDIYITLTNLGFSYYGDAGRHYSRLSGKLIYEDSVFLKKDLIAT
jgi:FkbM family methyltransferase